MKKYDVAIVGGGIVGATAALALAKTTALSIAVIEANPPSFPEITDPYAFRVSALALSSQRILQNLGCWEAVLAKRVCPYDKMQVWDAGSSGKIGFEADFFYASALGYIVEDWIVHSALIQQFQNYDTIDYLVPFNLKDIIRQEQSFILTSTDNTQIENTLLIAADGGTSSLRQHFNIATDEVGYGQTAIVATVKTSLPHQRTAWQRFLPTGPLAFLPLQDAHHCSIVWSVEDVEADKLIQLKDEAFQQRLALAFEYKLGQIEWISERKTFPLIKRQAKNYCLPQFALIGDAAHTVHPLAGQGLNLGLLDAVTLAEIMTHQLSKNKHFASQKVLRRYERWRKSEADIMLKTVGFLKNIFGSEKKSIGVLRGMGLNCSDQLAGIKRFLGNYALGLRDELPMLAREK